MKLEEIKELTDQIKELMTEVLENKEIIQPVIDLGVQAIKELANEVKPLIVALDEFTIQRRINQIFQLTGADFTKEEAIAITTDERLKFWASVDRCCNNSKK